MTIVLQVGGRWFGDAGDTKPTLGTEQAGHEFYVTDIPTKLIWSGTEWLPRAG